jgi:adenylate cyclase
MALEIERKFLVCGDAWRVATGTYYCQGYLNRDKHRTVRVRIAGDKAFLTVKGPNAGIVRSEFEYGIPVDDARQLLELCEKPLIEKHRRAVQHHGFTWEVDEFLGENEGLIIAEIELQSPDQSFDRPGWVGEEVTGDSRYYNSNLSSRPYRTWQGNA